MGGCVAQMSSDGPASGAGTDDTDVVQSVLGGVKEAKEAIGLSEQEKLEIAHKNGSREDSNTRGRRMDEPSKAFSDWHRRTIVDWMPTMDADWLYYDTQEDEVYLLVETICIRGGELDGGVNARYPLHDFKEDVYQWLNDSLDCPIYIVWHKEACDHFFVREFTAPKGQLVELNSEDEYQDWVDGFRPSSEVDPIIYGENQ